MVGTFIGGAKIRFFFFYLSVSWPCRIGMNELSLAQKPSQVYVNSLQPLSVTSGEVSCYFVIKNHHCTIRCLSDQIAKLNKYIA